MRHPRVTAATAKRQGQNRKKMVVAALCVGLIGAASWTFSRAADLPGASPLQGSTPVVDRAC